MLSTEQQVRRNLETYRLAVLTKNVETLLQLYAPDARVFDAWGSVSHEGSSVWRVAVEAWFSSLGSETCKVTFDDVLIAGDPDFAAMSAIVIYAAVSSQGQEIRAQQCRISWVLKISDNVLRIVHEHASVRVGFEEVKDWGADFEMQ